MRKISKIKRLAILGLIFLMSINSFAAIVSDNDGSAFVTKAEFDALKDSFAKQISNYNSSIDGKIDGAIAQYLSGLKTGTIERYKSNCSFFTYPLTLYGKRIIKTLDLGKTTPTYINQELGVTPPTNTHHEPLFGPDYVMFGAMSHGYGGERSWGYYYHKPTRYINKFYRGESVSGDTLKINGTWLPGAWTWTAFETPDPIKPNVAEVVTKTEMKLDTRKTVTSTDGPMYWGLGLAYVDQQGNKGGATDTDRKYDLSDKLRADFAVNKSTEDKPQRIWGQIAYRPYSFSNYAKQVNFTASKGVGGGSYNWYYGYAWGGNTPLSTDWCTNSFKFNTLNTVSELDISSVSGVAGTNNTTDYQVPVSIGDKVYVTNFRDKINVHNNPTGRLDLFRRTTLDNYDLFQGFVDGGLDLESEKQSTSRSWNGKSLIQSARIVYDAKFDDGAVITNHNMTHMIPLVSLSMLSSEYSDFTIEIDISYDGTTAPYIAFSNKAINQQTKPNATDINFLKIVKNNGTVCDASTVQCISGVNTFQIDGLASNDKLYYKLFWDSTNGEKVTINKLPEFSYVKLN